jgi:hypothetical protein
MIKTGDTVEFVMKNGDEKTYSSKVFGVATNSVLIKNPFSGVKIWINISFIVNESAKVE